MDQPERPRPHIPLAVRCLVVERQLRERGIELPEEVRRWALTTRLIWCLHELFGDEPVHLDHVPALRLRRYNPKSRMYHPDANDPDHLVYRTRQDHHIKTNVRGDGAQFSDVALMKRERRRDRKQKRTRYRWPSGRKIPSRPFPKR